MEMGKINWNLVEEAEKWATESFKQGYYFENLNIHILILEGTLRIALGKFLVEQREWKDEDAQKYVEECKTFCNLLESFWGVTGDKEMFERMDEIRKKRNKIIHNLFFKYKKLEETKNVIKELGPEIESLKEDLKKKYF